MLIEVPGQRLKMRDCVGLYRSTASSGLKWLLMWGQGMGINALKDGKTQLIHALIVVHGALKT